MNQMFFGSVSSADCMLRGGGGGGSGSVYLAIILLIGMFTSGFAVFFIEVNMFPSKESMCVLYKYYMTLNTVMSPKKNLSLTILCVDYTFAYKSSLLVSHVNSMLNHTPHPLILSSTCLRS